MIPLVWVRNVNLSSFISKTSEIEMMRALASRGFDCSFVVPKPTGDYEKPVGAPRVITFRATHYWFIFLSACFFVLPFRLGRQPHLIVTDYQCAPFLIPLKIFGSKIILDVRSQPVSLVGIKALFREALYVLSLKMGARLYAGITTITPMLKALICQRQGIEPNRIGLWSSGVNVAHFHRCKYLQHRGGLRRELGLRQRYVVLYHGSIEMSRGIPELIHAMKILARRLPDVTLLLVGGGREEHNCHAAVESLGLDNVIIQGIVPYSEIPKYLAAADLAVVPLPDIEWWLVSSPLKFLEYISMEIPVIYTDIPAHRLILHGFELGGIIRECTPESISESIEDAYHQYGRLLILSRKNRERVLFPYSWESVSARFASIAFRLTRMT